MQRIYLDNAATSWPKPPEVLQAIQEFYSSLGSASGRGAQASEFSSDHVVRQCRSELSSFLGGSNEDHLVFAFNGTDALNLGLWGILNPGDHVVTTVTEHNSVIRPLQVLADEKGVTFSQVECEPSGVVAVEHLEAALNDKTKLVVISHVSNVTGVRQDVESIGRLCRERGVVFMIDAAQSVGHMPVDFGRFQCDLLAAPGHKGLLGPLGTGFLMVSGRVADQMKCWRAGGTGTASEKTVQPESYPQRLEAGNLNVGGIAGLLAGLRFVKKVGVQALADAEHTRLQAAIDGLEQIPKVRLLSSGPENARLGVLSFEVVDQDPREVAMILDSTFAIQTRAGLHCAPGMHRFLGTFDRGGAIRISPNWYTRAQDIDRFIDAISEIANA